MPNHPPQEVFRRYPDQMPEPPQLPPLNVEDQRFYRTTAPPTISLRWSPATLRRKLFSRLHPQSHSHSSPQAVRDRRWGWEQRLTGQKRVLLFDSALSSPQQTSPHYCRCCTNPPVNLPLHFSITSEQDPEIHKLHPSVTKGSPDGVQLWKQIWLTNSGAVETEGLSPLHVTN